MDKIKNKKLNSLGENDEYIALNAQTKLFSHITGDYSYDTKAVEVYMEQHVLPNTKVFANVKERFDFLIKNNYYDEGIVMKYKLSELEKLTNFAYSYNFKFPSFMGALKFYSSYCLKSNDDTEYLERYEDRAIMNSLFVGNGSFKHAKDVLKEIMEGRYQPATPTFLNAGKKQRGEYISCYLLRVEDNMESIARGVSTSLQLSKRGGGVALCLTNLREMGAPIKNIQGQATGVVPVIKILEDSFSYANQLGQRQGAGAVYLSAHHPDILTYLDTKKENADEKIRIKSLSLGIVIPDITFELAKNNEDMALFSPYDIMKVYGKAMSDISITKEYYNMVNNPKIKKTFINARAFFQKIAELHFESGYPYLLFDDTVNNRNAHPNRIVMSNLCSEIAQPNTPSEFSTDLSFIKKGEDVACNLGSMNIDKLMKAGSDFGQSIYSAIWALNHIANNTDISSAPSIENGNRKNRAIGLGAMNLHGFLAINKIKYASPEAVDFTNIFFYTFAYHAFKASNNLAKEGFGKFSGFEKTKFANGEYFEKYTKVNENEYQPKTSRVKELFREHNVTIPSRKDWIDLSNEIQKTGLANSHLMAIAPTGSISYLSSCTPSLQPVVSDVEVRKEGKVGRLYVPAYKINKENREYYLDGAYEVGPYPIIDIVSEAQKHIDQAISLTLFFKDNTTTRELNKAYIYAFKKKCSSIYYVRVRQDVLEGSENHECKSCVL
ncbi:class 1b ribonucleoside-diphosphate reductase subunit alpha [Mycoplasma sp. Mirounga ES2805-ORL]|uniref:class 1b ribonucleoside-diphosphate reductase subunit alpha n=1 Tax=Mycoplasma sp. Mirounga ES2805-ORL TaxID=754514 RepID=UPI00197BA0E6|nr:class 1b ribonucleoside-diphosphate reductase subunit alpha [Mycoplasma sp. Mirounga ES2805-ORL]QSF13809.1 class 1b ribonucleoside-diphosphate reductase subunit alpha [Mycoplasma sp. Mirounga ES2805-ORL]